MGHHFDPGCFQTTDSIKINLTAQRDGSIHRQGAVVGAYPMTGLVVENFSHNGKASFAAPPDTPAGGGLDAEIGGNLAVNLVQAVFLEEQGIAPVGNSPGEGTVTAQGNPVTVGGQS